MEEQTNDSQNDESHEAQRERLLQEWREIIKQLIEEKPDRFIELLCQGVLADLGTPESWMDQKLKGSRRRYLTVATFAMKQLTGTGLPPPPEQDYASLAELIEEEFDSTSRVDRHLHYPHYKDVTSSPELVRIFFEPVIDSLEIAVGQVTQWIYHGVPVYERQGEQLRLADERSEELCYLRQRGSRFETVSDAHIPEWATRYFLSRAHLRTYHVFFRSHWEQTPEEIAQLRAAYRHALGIPLQMQADQATKRTTSRLLELVDATCDRYYGDNFRASDSDTWPRQKDVVDWLRKTHNLSEREAQAVDIVCRPDVLRGK